LSKTGGWFENKPSGNPGSWINCVNWTYRFLQHVDIGSFLSSKHSRTQTLILDSNTDSTFWVIRGPFLDRFKILNSQSANSTRVLIKVLILTFICVENVPAICLQRFPFFNPLEATKSSWKSDSAKWKFSPIIRSKSYICTTPHSAF
jgi:hypothetical protein